MLPSPPSPNTASKSSAIGRSRRRGGGGGGGGGGDGGGDGGGGGGGARATVNSLQRSAAVPSFCGCPNGAPAGGPPVRETCSARRRSVSSVRRPRHVPTEGSTIGASACHRERTPGAHIPPRHSRIISESLCSAARRRLGGTARTRTPAHLRPSRGTRKLPLVSLGTKSITELPVIGSEGVSRRHSACRDVNADGSNHV